MAEKLTRLPCDALSAESGLISSATFKKPSDFKTTYFQKSLYPEKENLAGNIPTPKQLSKSHTLTDFLFRNPDEIKKINGLSTSLCDENKEPKYGLGKLRAFLRRFGGFPEDMRGPIWGYLLRLPVKQRAYEQLKFLGEFKGGDTREEENHVKSIRDELDKWKSRWNPKREW